MRTAEKKMIINGMKLTILHLFGEHTGPEVKNSEKNKKVAEVIIALDKLIKE